MTISEFSLLMQIIILLNDNVFIKVIWYPHDKNALEAKKGILRPTTSILFTNKDRLRGFPKLHESTRT